MGRFEGTDLPYSWALNLLKRAVAKQGTERGTFNIRLASDYSSPMDAYYEGEEAPPMDVYFDNRKIESPIPEFHETLRGWVRSGVIEITGRIPHDASPLAVRETYGTDSVPLPGETIQFRITEFGHGEIERWIAEEDVRPSGFPHTIWPGPID